MDGIAYSYTDRGTLYRRVEGTRLETFTYDALGNLTRVERNGGPDIDYLIDAQSRRVGKRVDGALTKQYVWSGGLRVAAELQDGEVVSRFIYGNGLTTPDLILRRGTTDRLYRVISDHLGSPIYVVNIADADDVWLDASYDEWGNVTSFKLDGVDQGTSRSAWPIPQGFAGGLFDPDTGLLRFGARDYDPRTGRWTAKDPILFEGGQGNLYVYVGNDPINRIDPLGLRVYTEGEVASILDEGLATYNDRGLIDTLGTALGSNSVGRVGPFDFRLQNADDTFMVPGIGELSPSEFGKLLCRLREQRGFGATRPVGDASRRPLLCAYRVLPAGRCS